MKKRSTAIATVCVILTAFLFIISSCSNNDPVLSGRYQSVDDNSVVLMFEGNTVTLFEDNTEVRSGTYRWHNDTLILNWDGLTEAFTLDESQDNLFQGNSARDDFGELVFTRTE